MPGVTQMEKPDHIKEEAKRREENKSPEEKVTEKEKSERVKDLNFHCAQMEAARKDFLESLQTGELRRELKDLMSLTIKKAKKNLEENKHVLDGELLKGIGACLQGLD